MKKIVFLLFTVFILAAIGLFFYTFLWAKNETGALQVTSSPQSKVYLDGKYLGTTPLCMCPQSNQLDSKTVQEMLPIGDYTIRLVPTSGNLPEFQEKITIEKSVLTVVDRKFAEGASAEGVVISLTDIHDTSSNELTVVSLPDKVDVYLDDSLKGKTPLSLKELTPSDHTLTLQKEGYKTKTIRIRATNGYKLVAKGYLSIDPSFVAGVQANASSSASPSPGLTVAKVRILETGTGFLRVRSESSLGAEEVARVSPGEEYTLLEEQTGWFQIQLVDQSKGWISSQYAEKLE